MPCRTIHFVVLTDDIKPMNPLLSPSKSQRFSRYLALTALLSLIVLCLLWESVLAPLPGGNKALVLKTLPLCLPLLGLLKNKLYTYRWLSLFILIYLAEGAVRIYSDRGLSAILAGLELALCTLIFIACLVQVRSQQAAGSANSI
jgi:uncharacterized membrane protein